jgi:hypothetical protein
LQTTFTKNDLGTGTNPICLRENFTLQLLLHIRREPFRAMLFVATPASLAVAAPNATASLGELSRHI